MHLFNGSSLFNENIIQDLLNSNGPDDVRNKIIKGKKELLKAYRLEVLNLPGDFTYSSAIIAANHLTDADAPLIMSFYYELMHRVKSTYPELFVFAKENCFNGVSIPIELKPVLHMEKIYEVDRNRVGGSLDTIKIAKKWYSEGEQPKHFLIFAQGTIFDINREKAADIEKGTFWLASALGIPVLPVYLEQAVEGVDNRLIFGESIVVPRPCSDYEPYKQLWIERVIEAQNRLEVLTGRAAREIRLDEEHRVRKTFKMTLSSSNTCN